MKEKVSIGYNKKGNPELKGFMHASKKHFKEFANMKAKSKALSKAKK